MTITRLTFLCLTLVSARLFANGIESEWLLKEWNYRVPIQIFNRANTPVDQTVLAAADIPFLALISEGKLSPDGRDFRLLDNKGESVPLRVERILSDNGDSRLMFPLDSIDASSRRIFWLYYGNPAAFQVNKAEIGTSDNQENLQIGYGAEQKREQRAAGSRETAWPASNRLIEAETGSGTGFSVLQPTKATIPFTSGGKIMFSGGSDFDKFSLETDVEAGNTMLWMRYSPALPGFASKGAFSTIVTQSNKELAKLKIDMGKNGAPGEFNRNQENPGFIWVAMPIIALKGTIRVTVIAANANLAVDCFVISRDNIYKPSIKDFQNDVWVRWRIDKPADYRFLIKVNGKDSIGAYGLNADSSDYIQAGAYSPWIQLTADDLKEGHAIFSFPPNVEETLSTRLTARLEFANRPAPSHVFRVIPSEPLEIGSASMGVLFPAQKSLKELPQIISLTEWGRKRQQLVEKIASPPPPRLSKLHVGTWMSPVVSPQGTYSPEKTDIDLKTAMTLGFNFVVAAGISDQQITAGKAKYGFVDSSNSALAKIDGVPDRSENGIIKATVGGTDADIGGLCFEIEAMKALTRTVRLPLAGVITGPAIKAKLITFLMHGVKENGIDLNLEVNGLNLWGVDEKALAETAEATRLLKKFENVIAGGTVRASKAAMLAATSSDLMQKKGPYFLDERKALYITLQHGNTPVDIISEQDIVEGNLLNKYSLLYITDPLVSADTQRAIADWVQKGGKMWASVGAANWDETGQPCDILNPVFGVDKREMVTQESWQNADQTNYKELDTIKSSSDLFGPDLEFPVIGAMLECNPTTALTRGIYQDGKPAVLYNKYGAGKSLLVGSLVGEGYMRTHFSKDGHSFTKPALPSSDPARRLANGLLKAAGIVNPIQLSTPGIYSSLMDSQSGTIVFLNNAKGSGNPKTAITVNVRDSGVKTVESAKLGLLKFTAKNGVVSFSLPLPDVDIIFLNK